MVRPIVRCECGRHPVSAGDPCPDLEADRRLEHAWLLGPAWREAELRQRARYWPRPDELTAPTTLTALRAIEAQLPVIYPLEAQRAARCVRLAIVGAVGAAAGSVLQYLAPLLSGYVIIGAIVVLVISVAVHRRLALSTERGALPPARVRR